jgi:hypothetical protein
MGKLFKSYQLNKTNNNNLINKTNTLNKPLYEPDIFFNSGLLFDTGTFQTSPTLTAQSYSLQEGDLIPVKYECIFKKQIHIPEKWIPYVEFQYGFVNTDNINTFIESTIKLRQTVYTFKADGVTIPYDIGPQVPPYVFDYTQTYTTFHEYFSHYGMPAGLTVYANLSWDWSTQLNSYSFYELSSGHSSDITWINLGGDLWEVRFKFEGIKLFPAISSTIFNVALYHGVAISNWIMGGGGNWDSTGWIVTQSFSQNPTTYYLPTPTNLDTRVVARVRNIFKTKTTRFDNYLIS